MNKTGFPFLMDVICACAQEWHMTAFEARDVLESSGCLNCFLIPNYGTFQSRNMDEVVHSISQYVRKRGFSV